MDDLKADQHLFSSMNLSVKSKKGASEYVQRLACLKLKICICKISCQDSVFGPDQWFPTRGTFQDL